MRRARLPGSGTTFYSWLTMHSRTLRFHVLPLWNVCQVEPSGPLARPHVITKGRWR